MRAAGVVQQLCKSCRTCFMFYCMFYFTCDRSFNADHISTLHSLQLRLHSTTSTMCCIHALYVLVHVLSDVFIEIHVVLLVWTSGYSTCGMPDPAVPPVSESPIPLVLVFAAGLSWFGSSTYVCIRACRGPTSGRGEVPRQRHGVTGSHVRTWRAPTS